MTKRTVPDLKELFRQAAEIAKQVPDNMQEAAFNRAVDLLTGTEVRDTERGQKIQKKSTGGKSKSPAVPKDNDSYIEDLLESIDSTQYPGIKSANKVLDRSLMVLQIALNDHSVDGLSSPDISRILTDKFRISTTRNAINMALGKATDLVNRTPSGKGFKYRIMGPGEEYLARLEEGETQIPKVQNKKTSARKKTAKKDSSSESKQDKALDKKLSGKKKTKRKSKSSVGSKAAILSLIESGYFNTSRTTSDIRAYLKDKRGLAFDSASIRMTMLRLVRENKLDRDDDGKGKYEYQIPKP